MVLAETILGGAIANVLAKLVIVSVKYIVFAPGLKSELDKLKETLQTIQAVRLDGEELQHQMNRELRVWLGKLRDACASADDILDECDIAALQWQVLNQRRNIRKKVRYYSSSSNPRIFRSKMGDKIKETKETLDEIAADRNKFHISGPYVENNIVPVWRETHSDVDVSDVIGREEDIEQLVYGLKQLDYGNNHRNNHGVSVVSVVGIGGLGKTTLVKSVYNDEG